MIQTRLYEQNDMSRYTLRGRNGATGAAVGWDRPLNTFFAQVFRTEEDEQVAFIWEVTSPQELPTAARAIAAVKAYAFISNGLAATLETDRLKTLAKADGPMQLDAKARFVRRTP